MKTLRLTPFETQPAGNDDTWVVIFCSRPRSVGHDACRRGHQGQPSLPSSRGLAVHFQNNISTCCCHIKHPGARARVLHSFAALLRPRPSATLIVLLCPPPHLARHRAILRGCHEDPQLTSPHKARQPSADPRATSSTAGRLISLSGTLPSFDHHLFNRSTSTAGASTSNSPSQTNLLRTRTTLCAARAPKTPFIEVWQKQVPSYSLQVSSIHSLPSNDQCAKESQCLEKCPTHCMSMLLLFIACNTAWLSAMADSQAPRPLHLWPLSSPNCTSGAPRLASDRRRSARLCVVWRTTARQTRATARLVASSGTVQVDE